MMVVLMFLAGECEGEFNLHSVSNVLVMGIYCYDPYTRMPSTMLVTNVTSWPDQPSRLQYWFIWTAQPHANSLSMSAVIQFDFAIALKMY